MNPPNKPTSGMETPPPSAEPMNKPATGSEKAPPAAPGAAEQAPAAAERAPMPPSAPPAGAAGVTSAAPTTIPLPASPMPPSGVAPAASSGSSLAVADDKDLIEKEWVHKAKEIVERTRDDPYKQSEDLTVFKADYIKKRYGKTIKLS